MPVAGVMSVKVVDFFQVIHIKHNDRKLRFFTADDAALQRFGRLRIGVFALDAGERIGVCLALGGVKLLLLLFLPSERLLQSAQGLLGFSFRTKTFDQQKQDEHQDCPGSGKQRYHMFFEKIDNAEYLFIIGIRNEGGIDG